MKVLKIGAIWCAHCVVMKPRWQEVEKNLPWLETQYFEYDDSLEIVNKYKLETEGVPAFIFLNDNGEEIARLNGDVPTKKLYQTIKECLKKEGKPVPEKLEKLTQKKPGFFSRIFGKNN